MRKIATSPLVFLHSLACIWNATECPSDTSAPVAGTDAKEPKTGLELASEAYESLFVSKIKLPEAEVVEKLEAFEPYFWEEKFAELHSNPDLSKLSKYKKVSKKFCVDGQRRKMMWRILPLTSDRYTALSDYMKSASERQIQLCEQRLPLAVDRFKTDFPSYWQMVDELHASSKTIAFKPPETHLQRTVTKLLESRLPKSGLSRKKLSKGAMKVVNQVEGACGNFTSNLGKRLQLADEIEDFLRHNHRIVLWTSYLDLCNRLAKADLKALVKSFVDENHPRGTFVKSMCPCLVPRTGESPEEAPKKKNKIEKGASPLGAPIRLSNSERRGERFIIKGTPIKGT